MLTEAILTALIISYLISIIFFFVYHDHKIEIATNKDLSPTYTREQYEEDYTHHDLRRALCCIWPFYTALDAYDWVKKEKK